MLEFDDLVQLYKDDPEAFEREKNEVIEDFISSLPPDRQQKARQIQWTLDGKLRKYKDPVARMNAMVGIFWEGFKEFQQAVNGLKEVQQTVEK